MKQFQQVQTAKGADRRNIRVCEVTVGLLDLGTEVSFRNSLSDKTPDDCKAELLIGQLAPLWELSLHLRQCIRNQQATVLSQPRNQGVLKGQPPHVSTCTQVAHDVCLRL